MKFSGIDRDDVEAVAVAVAGVIFALVDFVTVWRLLRVKREVFPRSEK